eukprot:scaffold7197_cov66-Attheya_sp.AAC.2
MGCHRILLTSSGFGTERRFMTAMGMDGMQLLEDLHMHLLAEDLATIPTLGLGFNVTAANWRLSHRCAIVRG